VPKESMRHQIARANVIAMMRLQFFYTSMDMYEFKMLSDVKAGEEIFHWYSSCCWRCRKCLNQYGFVLRGIEVQCE
jgi:hypothetical protein